jgi:hypothetical protein
MKKRKRAAHLRKLLNSRVGKKIEDHSIIIIIKNKKKKIAQCKKNIKKYQCFSMFLKKKKKGRNYNN